MACGTTAYRRDPGREVSFRPITVARESVAADAPEVGFGFASVPLEGIGPEGEDGPSQPLRTQPLNFQCHLVILRQKAEEIALVDGQAGEGAVGHDTGRRSAVLQQTDFTDESSDAQARQAPLVAFNQGLPFVDKEQPLAVMIFG